MLILINGRHKSPNENVSPMNLGAKKILDLILNLPICTNIDTITNNVGSFWKRNEPFANLGEADKFLFLLMMLMLLFFIMWMMWFGVQNIFHYVPVR